MSLDTYTITPEVRIAKKALDEPAVASLSKELDQLWDDLGTAFAPFDGYEVHVSETETVGGIRPLLGPVLRQVIEVCEIPDNATVSVNTYEPMAASTFHRDWSDKSVIVHASDAGAYDFSRFARTPWEARRNFMALEVGAGDIVFSSGKILHRGRNAGQAVRRNVAFFVQSPK